MKKGQIGATIFIPVVIAVIVLGLIFGFINAQRSTTTITDDQFTASNTSCVEITDNCIVSITSLENSTGSDTIGVANYSLCIATGTTGEYDGVYLFGDTEVDAHFNGATVNATYIEQSCNQITGLAGTIVDYIPVILAVVLLLGVAVYIK